jgi:hypothetical protein
VGRRIRISARMSSTRASSNAGGSIANAGPNAGETRPRRLAHSHRPPSRPLQAAVSPAACCALSHFLSSTAQSQCDLLK